MIKLSASVSKKAPVPDVEFSSRSYSAGMEVEISSDAREEELRERLRSFYELLEASIQEQTVPAQGHAPEGAAAREGPEQGPAPEQPPGAGNSPARPATRAQLQAIRVIAREHGYGQEALGRLLSDRFGVKRASVLSISQASSLIDLLKGNGKE